VKYIKPMLAEIRVGNENVDGRVDGLHVGENVKLRKICTLA